MILEGVGMALIGTSVALGAHGLLRGDKAKKQVKKELERAFHNAELFKSHKYKDKTYKQLPKVISTTIKPHQTALIFNIPYGLNPEAFEEKEFVFRQHFGKHAYLEMEDRRGTLEIYPSGLPTKFKYDLPTAIEAVKGLKVPILCGKGLNGQLQVFCLAQNPHILIAGETGSGKSSQLRSILTTIINTKTPKEVRLVLGDLKRSEFHLFKRIKHVDGVYHSAQELLAPLKKVQKEMTRRGDLLDEAEVNNIDELDKKLPYIVICIDEVALLKKEKEIMDILEQISSIGRSLGCLLCLSLQRPDSKLLEGALKANLTVRMGFQVQDSVNANIIGTKGSERISDAGRMILKIDSEGQEIQCPLLKNDDAKKMLTPYKTEPKPVPVTDDDVVSTDETIDDYAKVLELLQDE